MAKTAHAISIREAILEGLSGGELMSKTGDLYTELHEVFPNVGRQCFMTEISNLYRNGLIEKVRNEHDGRLLQGIRLVNNGQAVHPSYVVESSNILNAALAECLTVNLERMQGNLEYGYKLMNPDMEKVIALAKMLSASLSEEPM